MQTIMTIIATVALVLSLIAMKQHLPRFLFPIAAIHHVPLIVRDQVIRFPEQLTHSPIVVIPRGNLTAKHSPAILMNIRGGGDHLPTPSMQDSNLCRLLLSALSSNDCCQSGRVETSRASLISSGMHSATVIG